MNNIESFHFCINKVEMNLRFIRDYCTRRCSIVSIISLDKEIFICTFSQLKVILATSHSFLDKSLAER